MSTTGGNGEIDILASPLFPTSSNSAQTFEATIGQNIQRYFITIKNVGSTPIGISNISFTGLPPGVSVTYNPLTSSGFTLVNGKTLLPGDSLPELFFEGKLEKPPSDGIIYSISLNFRATSFEGSGNITNFSRVWFRLKPVSSSLSKAIVVISIILLVLLFVLVVGSLVIYFLIIRPKKKDSKSFLNSLDNETLLKLAMAEV